MALKMPGRRRRKDASGDASTRRSARQAARDSRPQKATGPAAGKAGNPLIAGLAEVAAIGREMLRIPAGIALRVAERLGLWVLAAWRFIRPLLLAALALARRALAVAEREVTPARAVAAVALQAAALLAVTQFLDYRDVRAGVPAYEGVEDVAPPPVVDGTPETAGSAHLYLLLLVAIASAVIVVLSMMGRWRLARSLVVLGLGAVVVAVFIDAPKGLDEGEIAVQFTGAEARLLGAFWVEVFAGGVIAACGPLLALHLRPAGHRAGHAAAGGSRDRGRRLRLGRSRVQGASS